MHTLNRDIRDSADAICRNMDEIETIALRLTSGLVTQAQAAAAFDRWMGLTDQYMGIIRASVGSLTHPPRQHPAAGADLNTKTDGPGVAA